MNTTPCSQALISQIRFRVTRANSILPRIWVWHHGLPVDMQCFPVYCACCWTQAQSSRRSWWLVARSACGENMWMQPISVHTYGERNDANPWIYYPTNGLKETYINQTLTSFYFILCLHVYRPRASAVAERLWSNEEQTSSVDKAFPRLEDFRCKMLRYW